MPVSEHVEEWLPAYHDGELKGRRLADVESHLTKCVACQAVFQELQAVSRLLQDSPAAPALSSPDRFVAQVKLRLPREQLQPAWKRTLESGWWLVPFVLLGVWVFIQAVLLVSGLVRVALQLGIGTDQLAAVFPLAEPTVSTLESFQLTGASLAEIAAGVVRLISAGGPFGWGLPLYLILTIVIGLIYWSWLASWRIRRKQLQN
jgi:anti-sigma factor RsiW